MSPYLLPDGNVQIAFSGGRTSAYMLHQILDANGDLPDRVIVSFQNTGRERKETLDFISECERRWSVPVLRLEYRPSTAWPLSGAGAAAYIEFFGQDRFNYMRHWWRENRTPDKYAVVGHNSLSRSSEPFEALVLARKYLPNQQQRFCTAEMKVRTSSRYLRKELGWDRWHSATGIRFDEPKRWKDKEEPRERWRRWMPLVAAKVGVASHVSPFWKMQPFDLRLPNVGGNCWLGNCDGCFLKSEANVAAFHRDFPEDARWWEGMEHVISVLTNSSSAAFWSKRYTRASMREFMERQSDIIVAKPELFWGEGGKFCQASDGECTG